MSKPLGSAPLPVLLFLWNKKRWFSSWKTTEQTQKSPSLFTATLSFRVILIPLLDFLGWTVSPSTALSTLDQYFVLGIWTAKLYLTHFQLMMCWSRAPWRQVSNTFGFDTQAENCTTHLTRTGMLRKRTPGTVTSTITAEWTAPPARGDSGLQVNGSPTPYFRLSDLWLLHSLSKRKLELLLLRADTYHKPEVTQPWTNPSFWKRSHSEDVHQTLIHVVKSSKKTTC